MKRSIYLLLVLVAAAAGCTKIHDNQPAVPLPVGEFTGKFLHIHKNITTSKLDTITVNLNLSLSATTGFAITGDTTLHAGSHGAYGVNNYYIQFIDETYSPSKPFTKYHLQGVYNYLYDGTKLNINVSYADTLSLQYMFKKNN